VDVPPGGRAFGGPLIELAIALDDVLFDLRGLLRGQEFFISLTGRPFQWRDGSEIPDTSEIWFSPRRFWHFAALRRDRRNGAQRERKENGGGTRGCQCSIAHLIPQRVAGFQ